MNIYKSLQSLPSFRNPVITIGSFDGIHKGHLKIFQRIKRLAREYDGEDVVVTFHPHPRSIIFPRDKSLKILTTLDEKLTLMKAYGISNVVVIPFTVEFSQQSSREYLEKFILNTLRPKCLVVGYDHRFGLNREGDFALLKIYADKGHFDLVEIKKEEIDEITVSSTKIRIALESGNLDEANSFLGHKYILNGTVVKGDSIGRSIGFPTANLKIPIKDKLIPPYGIYAVKVIYNRIKFGGMLYIGDRPTLTDNSPRIEVNIFDFNENIYGDTLSLELIAFVRADLKLESLEALREQLFKDEEAVKNVLRFSDDQQHSVNTTIAILNYNGEEMLDAYLPSIHHGLDDDLDIVVIDNASTDTSIEFIEEWYPEIRVVELRKNYGFAEGYNLGLQEIFTKYTVLLNSDVETPAGWLEPIIELMEADKTIGVVQPKIKSLESKNSFEYAGAAGGYIDWLYYPFCRGRVFETVEQDKGQYDDTREIAWASGCAMVVRTDLFKALGGFDEIYFAHQEEIDFCLRAQKAGYKVVAYGGSEVYHLGGGTLSYEDSNKLYLNFRNSLMNILKHETFPLLIFTVFLRLCLDIFAGLKFLVQGQAKSLFLILKAHLYIHVYLPDILMKRNMYNDLVRKASIGERRFDGRAHMLLPWQYYGRNRKIFSDLKGIQENN